LNTRTQSSTVTFRLRPSLPVISSPRFSTCDTVNRSRICRSLNRRTGRGSGGASTSDTWGSMAGRPITGSALGGRILASDVKMLTMAALSSEPTT